MADYVTFNGTDLRTIGTILGGFTDTPPAPKTAKITIPNGDDIDATDNVGLAYENRTIALTIHVGPCASRSETQAALTRLIQLMDGVHGELTLSWDEGATYTGRATVTEVAMLGRGHVATVEVEIDCSPWRNLGTVAYTVNADGGGVATFAGPKKAACPVFTLPKECVVVWNGDEETLPSGTYSVDGWVTEEANTFLAVSLASEERLVREWADTVISEVESMKTYSLCYKAGGTPIEVSAAIEWKEL